MSKGGLGHLYVTLEMEDAAGCGQGDAVMMSLPLTGKEPVKVGREENAENSPRSCIVRQWYIRFGQKGKQWT